MDLERKRGIPHSRPQRFTLYYTRSKVDGAKPIQLFHRLLRPRSTLPIMKSGGSLAGLRGRVGSWLTLAQGVEAQSGRPTVYTHLSRASSVMPEC